MINTKLISYNVNNNHKAIYDLYEYINSLSHNIVIVSIQEYFSNINYKFKYIYKYHRKMYGIHLLILSNTQLKVSFYMFCLGRFYIGNKGFILATINGNIICASVHLKDGLNSNDIRIKQFTNLCNLIEKVEYQYKILLGDFNFRFQSINDTNLDFQQKLVKYDQFNKVLNDSEYLESKITFPFTYKYIKNTLNMKRVPSYCDRIIYKANESFTILKYDSLKHFINSDHKPVFLDCKIENLIKKDKILQKDYISEISTFLYDYIIICVVLLVFCLIAKAYNSLRNLQKNFSKNDI